MSLKRHRYLLLGTAAVILVTVGVLYFLGTVLLTLGISAVAAYVLLAGGPAAGTGNALAATPSRAEPGTWR